MGSLQTNQWCIQVGIQTFALEINCKQVVDGVRQKQKGDSEFQALLANCFSILSNFQNSRMSLVRKKG